MKKAQRKIVDQVFDDDGKVTELIYIPITAEAYRLKRKYRSDKPS